MAPQAGAERTRLLREIHQLWKTLLDARLPPGSKERTRRFLKRHERTYLANLDVDWLLSVMERTEAAEAGKPKPPSLISKRMSRSGAGNPWLLDDLSERLYGAYRALTQSKIRPARQHVAGALNARKLYSSARRGPRRPWNSDAVIERVNQYEKQLRKGDPAEITTKDARARHRQQAANKWIYLFRTSESPESATERPD